MASRVRIINGGGGGGGGGGGVVAAIGRKRRILTPRSAHGENSPIPSQATYGRISIRIVMMDEGIRLRMARPQLWEER